MPPERDDADEFYVGYLPMPRRHRRFTVAVTTVLIAGVVVVAGLVAAAQRDPGKGVWDDALQSVEGELVLTPYPALRLTLPDADRQTWLLVSEGKLGASAEVAAMAGRRVRLSGTVLQRDGWRMLELADGVEARVLDAAVTGGEPGEATPPSPVTLTGEIIDPKCYFGAMKPGEGKTHKACAALCLRGGVPPMFIALTDRGEKRFFVLADAEGRAFTGDALEALIPFVGDLVRVRGVTHRGELPVLRLDPRDVQRL